MRVFLNMGLTEHTEHGVPTIIKKYGKEVFEITDNYTKCRIPYNKKCIGDEQAKCRYKCRYKCGINKSCTGNIDQ